MRIGVQHFFFQGLKKNYIVIWSCMLLEDVMHVFSLLALQTFVGQFVIILDMNNTRGPWVNSL
jgi:hypothetical protein